MAPFQASGEDVDFELLASYLKALSNPGRLELLWHLRAPQRPAALTLHPRRRDGMSKDRPVSRQTVEEHLARLGEVGVVKRLAAEEGGADRWVTDVPHVFAVVEELRKLTSIPAAASPVLDETMTRGALERLDWPKGPKVVLVSGPWEGRAFPLTGAGPWRLGRSRSSEVALTYDPYVSAEHAALHREGAGWRVVLDPERRNALRINFAPLAPGAARAVAHGDILELGRSLLVMHER